MTLIHIDYGIVETLDGKSRVIPCEQPSGDSTFPQVKALFARFEDLPVLDISGTGSTGYIDFITPEMMSESVMRGEDDYGRPFVAFKLLLNGKKRVSTLFRRYRCGSVWTSGGDSALCASALAKENLEYVSKLLKGETLKHRYYSDISVKLA